MRKQYIVIGRYPDTDGYEPEKTKSYAEALTKANKMADEGLVDIVVGEVKAEIILSKKVVEY